MIYFLIRHHYILVDEKRYDEAISIYKTVHEITPNDANIVAYIANTYVLMGNYTQAVKYYKKAMKLSPKDNEIKLIYLDMINSFIEAKKRGEVNWK